MSRRRVCAGFCALWTALAGCGAPLSDAPPASPVAKEDWPARITDGLERLAECAPALLPDEAVGTAVPRAPPASQDRAPRAVRVVRAVRCGLGIVLELAPTGTDAATTAPADASELAFVSFSPLEMGDAGASLPEQLTSGAIAAGVRWQLYEPARKPARGLAVHLGGNKYVRRALLRDGWSVLNSTGTGRYFRRRASAQTFELRQDEELPEVGKRIAAIVDDELADWPYSLEAVLEYLAQYRPDVAQRPLVVMGFSIGALGLPAVVARLPERFDAAVLVAGGANLLEISQRTGKAERGLVLRWRDREARAADWHALCAAYLERAKLDPYHTAVALRGLPTLVCQGLFDQVVPARCAELLYARLGRPKRLAYPVGHRQLLRLVMRLEAGRIVEWADAVVGSRSSSAITSQPCDRKARWRRCQGASSRKMPAAASAARERFFARRLPVAGCMVVSARRRLSVGRRVSPASSTGRAADS